MDDPPSRSRSSSGHGGNGSNGADMNNAQPPSSAVVMHNGTLSLLPAATQLSSVIPLPLSLLSTGGHDARGPEAARRSETASSPAAAAIRDSAVVHEGGEMGRARADQSVRMSGHESQEEASERANSRSAEALSSLTAEVGRRDKGDEGDLALIGSTATSAASAAGEVSEEAVQEIVDQLEDKLADGSLSDLPVVGADASAMTANVRALLLLGAKRSQVIRLFRAHSSLACASIAGEMVALTSVLAEFAVPRKVMLQALTRSLDFLSTPPAHAREALSFLDSHLAVNNLARVVAHSPDLLSLPPSLLLGSVAYLRSLQLEDVGAALERNPSLLGAGPLDLQHRCELLHSLLHGRAGVQCEADALALLSRSPPLMLTAPEAAREAYRQLARLLGEDVAAELVTSRPAMLSVPPADVEESVGHLLSHFGVEWTPAVLTSSSAVLRRKWEKTALKLDFLTVVMGRDVRQVAAWPAVLSFSLRTRIQRRYEALTAAGDERGRTEPLRSLFGCSDAVFERRFRVLLPKMGGGKR